MKQDKVINIILVVVNTILMVVCAVLYLKSDRVEPRFVVQPSVIVYTPGMEQTALYEGLSAHDDRDGEITDKIVIEKIVENQAEGTAIVYYAVSDIAGNTAKFSKLFRAEYPVEVSAAVSESGREEQVVMELERDQSISAEDEADRDNDEADADSVEVAGEGDSGEDSDEAPADEEDDRMDDADNENDSAENEANETPATPAVRNSGAPELVFRTTEVKVDQGANVPWTEIISTLRDDKDDYATLYYNLQVGQYNRNKPGTYQVDVYTEDSDGNRSQTVPVTIIVR